MRKMRRRVKTITGGSALVLVFSVLTVWPFTGCNNDEPSEAEVPAAAAPSVTLEVVEDTLSSGQSLYTSLVGSGVDASRAIEVLDVLGGSVNLRSCKPGDSYTAEMSSDGAIVSLCYRRGLREIYRVSLDSLGYDVAADTIPLTVFTRRIEGVLKTCLWEACLEAGEDPQIALKLSDVLGWEIDFVTDPRAGDTFTMIYEELYCDGRKVGLGDVLGAVYVNEGEEHIAIGFAEPDGTMEYYDCEGNSVRRVFLKSPLNYRRISSYFSNRRFHPILKIYRPHYGVDYAAPTGTPVVTIGDGRVTRAGWNGGFGNYVEIRHNNIYTSCYGHLSKYGRGIRGGARVRQGQIIGYVGATGLATGPHLDFRVKKYGSYVNPLAIDYPRGEPVGEERKEAFFARRDLILKGLMYRELAAADSSGG
jgi:murein DD-endopeptidase MepM/ murein hydrolase activator NlpD